MGEVFIIGAATALLGGARAPGADDLARAAAEGAMASAKLERGEIAALFVGSPDAGAKGRGRAWRPPGLEALRSAIGAWRAEQVTSSAGEALHLAWQAVDAGAYDIAMCIGLDDPPADLRAEPWPNTRAVRPYAAAAQRYMSASGATVDHLARVAAKNHKHGALHPQAAEPMGVVPEAVLESEMVAWPLRRLMVAPRSVGAAAVVLGSAAARRRLAGPAARVMACAVAQEGGGENGASSERAARLAYQAAGIGPDEVDCAELDDHTAAAELAAYESLQFAPEGQGPELIDSGFTALGGVLPVNTSGGLLTLGAGQASGIAQLCEVAAQVCGTAGERQVAGARVGLVHSRAGSEQTAGPVALTILSSE